MDWQRRSYVYMSNYVGFVEASMSAVTVSDCSAGALSYCKYSRSVIEGSCYYDEYYQCANKKLFSINYISYKKDFWANEQHECMAIGAEVLIPLSL